MHWLILLSLLPNAAPPARDPGKAIREVAGSAEYLRSVPKKFGTLVKSDPSRHIVTIKFDKEKEAKDWPLLEDAEVKVDGWWGRLEQIKPGTRVWAWMKTNRKGKPVAIAMLADDISQKDIHGTTKKADIAELEKRRTAQRKWLREQWLKKGLPGVVSFVHVFSGEMDFLVEHEAMRWARNLRTGDKVKLMDDPPITAVVKSVRPWRERTLLRLVAKSRDLADLKPGRRLDVKVPTPSPEVEADKFPPDMGRARVQEERVEWFLASIYCTCGVKGDVCTGHFYTLASCNPNGCGKPNQMRKRLNKLIEKGLTDRQIMETLLKEEGPGLLQPHLLP
jgi:hypothetical protein